jgi:serine/threonine protein kinase
MSATRAHDDEPGVAHQRDRPARGRFEIRGKLGAGAMGVVYRAFDRQRGIEVALKTLRHANGRDLYRFKREFRVLADVVHPHLVTLYELHATADDWFLTMELVDGVPFIHWVRPPPRPVDRRLELLAYKPIDETAPTLQGGHTTPAPTARQRIVESPLRVDRLADALYQLVDTVHALHQVGKLHRDLKPSNVLVDRQGRLVVLDFGLISDVDRSGADSTHETTAVGTPAYMSPEQASDLELTPASDWYSVGVMLYEALTGRRPFDLLGARPKLGAVLPDPRTFDAAAPEPLAHLALELLDPQPARRPDGSAILRALGREPSLASQLLVQSLAVAPFVGREAELATLRGALHDTRGSCVAVLVRGASGIGKSALLRHFLAESGADADAIVLSGRCHERESLPFKTLDTVIDSLTNHLARLDEAELAAILPRDIVALTRLFPVLRRVPAIAEPAVRGLQPPDPLELRGRAFGALRVLLRRLAERHPVILAIDDVQWGDADSGTFLAELMHHPDAPAILLILSHRSEDEGDSELLAALRRGGGGPATWNGPSRLREITLGPLADDEARLLASRLRGDDAAGVQALVSESGGSPLFLSELAHVDAAAGVATPSLEEVVRLRVERLTPEARALLEVCAVAAHPVDSALAMQVTGAAQSEPALAQLRAERLLRVHRSGEGAPRLEAYHDRIRAAVVAMLSSSRQRRLHTLLAEALEASPTPDHEALVDHWSAAGELDRAALHAGVAAETAAGRMAFHRAADLYALAITHGHHDASARRTLLTRMGHALAFAGRLDEAAAAFGAAAALAAAGERLELERLELEQLLRAGRVPEGFARARHVLAVVGGHLPRTRGTALVSLLRERLLLRAGGLHLASRPADELGEAERARIDVLYSLASGLSFVDPAHGAPLQTRHLRAALASGDAHASGIALALHLCYEGVAGARRLAPLEKLRERALAIGWRAGDADVLAITTAAGGLLSFLNGRWQEAWARLHDGERLLRETCTRVRWQLDLTESYLVSTAWYLGETRELTRLASIYLREAGQRGDIYAQRALRGWRGNVTWLVQDRPDEARAQADAVALPHDTEHSTQLGHYFELLTQAQIDLYAGEGERAHARVEARWGALRRGALLRIQTVLVEGSYLRGRCALAAAARAPIDTRRPLLGQALAAARRIEREATSWGEPLARLLEAQVARLEGDDTGAVELLRTALAGFQVADMGLYAAIARRRLGALLGGDAGAALTRAGDELMHAQAIVDVEAMTRMLAPGW